MPKTQRRILIVEDEVAIAKGLQFNFQAEGYEAIVAGDGPTALEQFPEDVERSDIDIVVLDLMLPGMSGYEICRTIRDRDAYVPILILSARELPEDKAHAFDCGTDQYMTKPFALPELLSRVRNLLERRNGHDGSAETALKTLADEFEIGSVVVDLAKYEVRTAETVHPLTTMEAQLLRYFIQHEGIVLSRAQIMRDVWDQASDISNRSVDNFVMRLRKHIEIDPAEPQHLLSVRGTGYRFVRES